MDGDLRWGPDVLGEQFESAILRTQHPDGTHRVATLIRHLPEMGSRSNSGETLNSGTAEAVAGANARVVAGTGTSARVGAGAGAGAGVGAGTAAAHGPSSPRRAAAGQAVLYLHGWSDYFFNPDLAAFWADLGIAFYALDLHNHGRSLREGDLGGFVGHLQDYDAELHLALAAVAADLRELRSDGRISVPPRSSASSRSPEPPSSSAIPEPATTQQSPGPSPSPSSTVPELATTKRSPEPVPQIALMGHSTGGLVAALWASRHPGTISHLILNSPWLEMYGSALVRHAAYSVVQPFARFWPQKRMRLPERNFYWRSISSQADGGWELDNALRPPKAFPIRLGWMSAILAGQASVAKGLRIQVPILVLMSARSMNGPFWKDSMHTADVVLDVHTMAARAGTLGSTVAIEKIEGGLHDVLLSERAVRDDAYARLRRWVQAFMFIEGRAGMPADGGADGGPGEVDDGG
ncbi:alpha/beta fold hydrolase [Paenarthrobacter sp. Z7-10]|uniref:alpha/beta hydrolase n=1 Tax=Paenarthrobacter sp. Z7-10 TaxID=2787635 RepID=UPI0022A93686|nr:alpha/beta fold hydrolase [Paenarthrobacter sp. Z7-10]MCZ2404300.1 alpha/beta fold hydrolase [Paenarthrobacter sp. Z7-10]